VAFFGNVANALFQIVRAVRTSSDIDAHLFVNRSDVLFTRPESVDPDLAGAYPPWIHEGDWITPRAVLAPWKAAVTRQLAAFDLVVVSGPGPIFAQWAGRPWCWFVTGGDLTVKPFPLTFLAWYDGWVHKAGEIVGGTWQRRAARRAHRLWVQPFAPMQDALRRLGIPERAISSRYLPIVLDTDEFRPDRPVTDPDDPVVRAMRDADLAVFHPSRLVMSDDHRLRRSGQWKGNDTLIRGFARLVATGAVPRPLLVIPDIELSRDVAAGKALVESLGIAERVLWARPPRADGFPRHRIRDLYLASDVVATDFGVGWFGYATLEGLAVGRPVVTHIDDEPMRHLYPDGHPMVEAGDPEQVRERLLELWRDRAEAARVGAAGREWVVAHHSPAAAAARYVEAVEEVIDEVGLGGGRAGGRAAPVGAARSASHQAGAGEADELERRAVEDEDGHEAHAGEEPERDSGVVGEGADERHDDRRARHAGDGGPADRKRLAPPAADGDDRHADELPGRERG
jgi:glycosyltransferase involved in cell wall biosynthesis